MALATTQQLERVFDEDLWRSSSPGADEEFNPERFGLWLEILFELGSSTAAEKIAEMDLDFVSMALSQLIWVIAFDDLRAEVVSENRLEKIMDSTLSYEIEDFVLFSREPNSWDAVLRLITDLDQGHHALLRTVLETCAHFSTELIEDEGGLYSVLSREDQLKNDVAYEREKRREALGFVPPADARAFLKLAAGPLDAEDHISPAQYHHTQARPKTPSKLQNHNQSVLKIPSGRFAKVQRLLSEAPSFYMEQLNYLANVLVSGGNIHGHSPRPGEAAEIVLKTCEKGLERKPETRSFIEAFRAGWRKTKRR